MVNGRATLFACIICNSPVIFALTDTFFGCRTLVTLCPRHGPHWMRRSAQDEAAAEKAAR